MVSSLSLFIYLLLRLELFLPGALGGAIAEVCVIFLITPIATIPCPSLITKRANAGQLKIDY